MRAACKTWHYPDLRTYKLNIDAAFFDQTFEIGFDMDIRDHRGLILQGRTSLMQVELMKT